MSQKLKAADKHYIFHQILLYLRGEFLLVYLHTQQTPNPLAQDPEETPSRLDWSFSLSYYLIVRILKGGNKIFIRLLFNHVDKTRSKRK